LFRGVSTVQTGKPKSSGAALLSATLIVRDEERHLSGCLESLRGLADEIIVVDTGSNDGSRALAMAHGAKVFDFPWQADFSLARNHALDQASGDWILYIDADERVRPYDRAALKDELADRSLCAATVRFYPQSGFTAYREHRLFRRSGDIRFESAIHETIIPSLGRLTSAGHARIGSSGLTIDHLGYDGEQSHKNERDLALLLRQVKVDPGRTYLWWHLGSIYRARENSAQAESAWNAGAEAARRASSQGTEPALCFIELAKLRLSQSRPAEAMTFIRQAGEFHPGNLFVRWLEARALAAMKQYQAAIAIFEELLRVDASTLVDDLAYDGRIFGAASHAEIALCMFRSGRYAESEESYRRAQALEPANLEFRIKRQLAAARSV
jgi:tetratricopeptide (TPR) repeat protein